MALTRWTEGVPGILSICHPERPKGVKDLELLIIHPIFFSTSNADDSNTRNDEERIWIIVTSRSGFQPRRTKVMITSMSLF